MFVLLVCFSVSLLAHLLQVTTVYFGRMAEAIELLFGVVGRVGQGYHALDGGPDLPWDRQILTGNGA